MKREDTPVLALSGLSLFFGALTFASALLMPTNAGIQTTMAMFTTGATSALFAMLKQQADLPHLPKLDGAIATATIQTTQTETTRQPDRGA